MNEGIGPQIIWPLVWVPVAALVGFLIDRGFFFRSINVYRRIGEVEQEPWWMGVCFPRYKASQIDVAIIPLNWILIYTWRFHYWLRSKPMDYIWKEFGEMYQERQKLQRENKALRMRLRMYEPSDPDADRRVEVAP